MRLFKKRKSASIADHRVLVEAAMLITEKQRKAAEYLGRKTQYWNRNSKIVALVLFCLLFGGACLLLLIKVIIHC